MIIKLYAQRFGVMIVENENRNTCKYKTKKYTFFIHLCAFLVTKCSSHCTNG